MVLTERMARKYFGGEDPIGRTLRFNDEADFAVTGVMKDVPGHSHLQFDFLVSLETRLSRTPELGQEWFNFSIPTYVLFRNKRGPREIEPKLAALVEERHGPFLKSLGGKLEYSFQPLTKIRLSSRFTIDFVAVPGSMQYVCAFAAIALFILGIACMNFMNLATARSAQRAREVGLRKTVGAGRPALFFQFLGEATTYSLLSLAVALFLVWLALPIFKSISGIDPRLGTSQLVWLVPSLLGLVLFVGLAAGSYPAVYLSALQPVSTLKGVWKAGPGSARIRRVLVVVQFLIGIVLIIGTAVVRRQLGFMKGQALGFDVNQKLILRVQSNLNHFRDDYEAIKRDFLGHPSVRGATVSSLVPGDRSGSGYYMTTQRENFRNAPRLKVITVDEDFIPQYGIRMAAGRPFAGRNGPDRREAFIVNEAGAKALGFASAEDALGKSFQAHYNRLTKRIVGVTENFHFRGMKETVEPLILDLEPSLLSVITLSIRVERMDALLRFIRETWDRHFPGVPFEYAFLDESFGREYRYEEQMGRLLGIIAALGIGVACLGLFGLSSFVARRREKEIGVRKVLGASNADVVRLLALQYVRPVLAAVLRAAPVAWYAMARWLREFAYRIDNDVLITLVAAAGALAVALVTVGLQSLRAAAASPAVTLRNE